MLTLQVEAEEQYDDRTEMFSVVEGFTIHLEHSLVSVSKWEEKYQVPFLSQIEKTEEQTMAYVKAMLVPPIPPKLALEHLKASHYKAIQDYLESPQSATTFNQFQEETTRGGKSETITSELVYYWMTAFSIPFEAETWNLNRLFALMRICSIKHNAQNGGHQKISKQQMAQKYRDLNAERRAKTGSTG